MIYKKIIFPFTLPFLAALIMATPFAPWTPGAYAARSATAKSNKVVTNSSDIIKEAQEELLNGKRAEAIKHLVNALLSENRDSKNFKELKKALTSIGDVFLTIQAQKTYELGRSLLEKEPSAAVDKFLEALALEPSHQKVRLDLARAYLARGDCGQVADITKQALLENPYHNDFFLLRLQSKVCQSTIEDFEAELMNPYVEQDEIYIYLETAQAQHLIAKGKYSSAIEILNRAKARDPQFPEIYYWLSNARTKLKQGAEAELQKYVQLCKDEPSKVKSRYSREPRTCRELSTIQQQLEAIRSETAG